LDFATTRGLGKEGCGEVALDVALVPFQSDVGVPDLRGILEPFAGVMFALVGEDERAMVWSEPFEARKGEVRRFLLALVSVARPSLSEEDLISMERGVRRLSSTSRSGQYITMRPLAVLTGQSRGEGL
jgi:hypothetical protein